MSFQRGYARWKGAVKKEKYSTAFEDIDPMPSHFQRGDDMSSKACKTKTSSFSKILYFCAKFP